MSAVLSPLEYMVRISSARALSKHFSTPLALFMADGVLKGLDMKI